MPTIEIHNNRIYIWSELRDRDRVKEIPGSQWDKETNMWSLPLSWGSCVAMRGVFGPDLVVGATLSQWATEHKATKIDPAMSLKPSMEVADLMVTDPDLFPFQRVGVRFLETVETALLADDMGSGKTVQIIRTIRRIASLPVLVVCPNSMKFTWRDEFARWAPEYNVVVINGSAAQRRKQIATHADIYVINWESLRLHSRVEGYGSIALTETEKKAKELNAIPWSVVVADEGHRAKDPNSIQTRALWAVSRGARYRFAATGTPIESNPGEFWSLMNFISPDNFPRKTKYVDRYCAKTFNHFGGMEILGLRADTQGEFHSIVDPLILRRPKDVILPQLPPKVETVRYLSMEGKQEKAYRQMADLMLAELDGGIATALDPLQQHVRLSQFASAYAEMTDDGKVVLSMPSNKVEALLELLDEATGEQVVAFSESKQLVNIAAAQLQKKGITHGIISGDISPEQRQAAMKEFQENNLRVMLCTAAGAEGITLTAARILVFLQRFRSSIKDAQAADRVHRIGQERGVDIITFASMGTVEEKRELDLADKRDTLQEILQDDEVRRSVLSWGKKSRSK